MYKDYNNHESCPCILNNRKLFFVRPYYFERLAEVGPIIILCAQNLI